MKNCKLEANHYQKFHKNCFCGECKCGKRLCQYINNSWNCKKICIKDLDHEGPHLCEEKEHLCNEDCEYKKITRLENGGCLGKCKFPVGHGGKNHFCSNQKEMHKCIRTCSLKCESTEESCKKFCKQSIEHEGSCICINSPEKHICKYECQFKNNTNVRGCNISCCLPANHEKNTGEKCLCSKGKDGHLCNKICALFDKSRSGCEKLCCLKYNHEGDCICSAKKEDHICKEECSLKEKTIENICHIHCSLNAGHSGSHICQNKKENHICNGDCYLKNDSREGCYYKCIRVAGHEGNHMCSSKKHICNKNCKYKDCSYRCDEKCNKIAGHEDEDHLCKNGLEKHRCKQKCFFFGKTRIGCNEYCAKTPVHDGPHLCNSNLPHLCNGYCYLSSECHGKQKIDCNKNAGHEGEHNCLKDDLHKCNKVCDLANISKGCKLKCSLPYGHEELNKNHLCSGKHKCIKKCIFGDDSDCILEYGHKGECFCHKVHLCKKLCEEEGICEIITERVSRKKIVKLKNGEEIEYEEEDEQNPKKHHCIQYIPSQNLDHKDNPIHKCQMQQHKCGFRCKQCKWMCELFKGHKGLHQCKHGHIINANIYTEEKNIKINFLEHEYDFQNEDSAEMFTCIKYCKQQERGHIHILEKSEFEKIENFEYYLKKNFAKLMNKDLYECKCEFFWKNYLKFDFDEEFDIVQKGLFNKCPAICLLCKKDKRNKRNRHDNSNKKSPQYCELDLWHEPLKNTNENNNNKNFWISQEGHKFVCRHKIPCHSIFIIDKSGSMKRDDIAQKKRSLH